MTKNENPQRDLVPPTSGPVDIHEIVRSSVRILYYYLFR